MTTQRFSTPAPKARPRPPRRRRLVRWAALLATAFALLVGGAGAASAHATLTTTSPAEGTVLSTAPSTVTATFDETVSVSADSLRVFAPDGSRVDTGVTTSAGGDGRTITTGLRSGLGTGTYTVAWHVVSADSHPVQGAFTFSVGAPSATRVSAHDLGAGSDRALGTVYGVVRWVGYAGFAALVGTVAFLLVCWPGGARQRPVVRVVAVGWSATAAAAVLTLLLQGAYTTGGGFGSITGAAALRTTLATPLGAAVTARILLLAVVGAAIAVLLPRVAAATPRRRSAAAVGWGVLALGLAATWSSADHAAVGVQVPLAVAADMVHLVAGAIWLGGIVLLATVVLRAAPRGRPAGRAPGRGAPDQRPFTVAPEEAWRIVRAFSPLAMGCVAALVASGIYQTWRDVGGFPALTATTYGRLVLAKSAGAVVMVGLAAYARHRLAVDLPAPPGRAARPDSGPDTTAVPATTAAIRAASTRPRRAGSPARPRPVGGAGGLHHPGRRMGRVGAADGASVAAEAAVSLLRRSVATEAAVGAAVLALAAVLVETPTARETYAPPVSADVAFDTGGPGGSGTVHVSVIPARLGPNQLRLDVTDASGRPYTPAEIDAAFTLPARGIGPLPDELTDDGGGHYVGRPETLGFTGQWTLAVTVRSDDFDETTVTVPVPVH